ncbi:hypothetical protein [Micromonospora sp. MH33]|uniref:hypothetical protein n=1 Tax=Micromonospora sp. MH33 TaxID=1945509 RepID=UPI0011B21C8E|nr:hypothetical protein [Micromonospora sp. MH33]
MPGPPLHGLRPGLRSHSRPEGVPGGYDPRRPPRGLRRDGYQELLLDFAGVTPEETRQVG